MGLGVVIAVNGSADEELTGAAASIEVCESMGQTATYRLRFAADISGGDLPLLLEERISAGAELSLFTEVNGVAYCLVKGPVYGQQIHLVHGGAGSYVEVLGADRTLEMDRESKAAVWADVSDSDAVSSILGSYPQLSPDVESTSDLHPETKHTLVQRETDLRFVRRLARRHGFLFWIDCDETGAETAHFRRPQLSGTAAAELMINLDQPSLETADIAWDTERPTSTVAEQVDLNTKELIDGAAPQSPLTPLAATPLSSIVTGTRSLHLAPPADDSGDLRARGEGALIEAGFFVRATCSTTTTVTGAVLRAHTLVNLRGAGSRHSGNYYCAGVRHFVDASTHRMEVELVRNAWGA